MNATVQAFDKRMQEYDEEKQLMHRIAVARLRDTLALVNTELEQRRQKRDPYTQNTADIEKLQASLNAQIRADAVGMKIG